MPVNPEMQRQFDRFLWRERIIRTLVIAPPLVIGIGLVIGLIWLWSQGGPTWIGLVLAGVTALAKPALVVMRVIEKRRSSLLD
jgi:hypothetical protein